MHDVSLEISKTPLEEIYEVQVIDEYFLHLKDADCTRTITYENRGAGTVPINLTAINIAFFSTCENFIVNINGENQPDLFKEDYFNYSKVIKINYFKELLPGEKLEISIRCKWKNFVSMIDDCFFTFTFPESAKYKLILYGLNPEDKPHIFHIGEREAIKNTDYFITTDSVIFNNVALDRNNPLRVKLLMLSTPKKLPTFNYFLTVNRTDLSECIVILIQHLLSDFIHLVNAFQSSDVDKSHIFIVGIPYSTKDKTVKYIKLKGYKNLEIPLVYPFDEQVKNTIEKAIEVSKSTGKKILIVEDGGYAVPILHKHRQFIDEADRFVGAVEQTTNGIWRDEYILEKDKIPYCIPIIDVARSNIKLKLESPLIGRAVCRNIELLLGKEFLEISGKKVGVAGFGNTGSRIAKTLKDMGAQLTIYSDSNIDLNFAHTEGYDISYAASDLVKNSKIIIEATGHEWAGADVITAFQNGSYFISASSKRMGIKYKEFEGLIDKTVNLPGIGVKYLLTTDNTVTLLADGYPVNFFDSESVPDKAIEFIPTILFESAKFLIKKKDVVPKGIIGFTAGKTDSEEIKNIKEELNKLQDDIAYRHLDIKLKKES